MKLLRRIHNPEAIRNLVFGTEDSLVSTVGFVSGVAAAGVASETIILSGIVLILVEAFSMAVGALVSDNSVEEVIEQKEISYGHSAKSASIMFISYIVAGVCVLLPYVFLDVAAAFKVSIIIALVLLFLLGALSGYYARIGTVKKGLSVALIGGIAIVLGIIVGSLFNT